jgi:hypothetical protein
MKKYFNDKESIDEGIEYLKNGSYGNANYSFEEVISHNPKNPSGHFYRAIAQLFLDKPIGTIFSLRNFFHCLPQDVDLRERLPLKIGEIIKKLYTAAFLKQMGANATIEPEQLPKQYLSPEDLKEMVSQYKTDDTLFLKKLKEALNLPMEKQNAMAKGFELLKKSDYKNAKNWFREAIFDDPKKPFGYFFEAMAQLFLDKPNGMEQRLELFYYYLPKEVEYRGELLKIINTLCIAAYLLKMGDKVTAEQEKILEQEYLSPKKPEGMISEYRAKKNSDDKNKGEKKLLEQLKSEVKLFIKECVKEKIEKQEQQQPEKKFNENNKMEEDNTENNIENNREEDNEVLDEDVTISYKEFSGSGY